jgi:hypothetical protein
MRRYLPITIVAMLFILSQASPLLAKGGRGGSRCRSGMCAPAFGGWQAQSAPNLGSPVLSAPIAAPVPSTARRHSWPMR